MTKWEIVISIAAGVVLAQIVLQLLDALVEWAGKLVGKLIALAANRMMLARQQAALLAEQNLRRQRSPLVRESGRRADENHDATS